jgi:phage tail-like protein
MSENTAALLTNFNFRVKLRQSPQAISGATGSASAPQRGQQGTALGEGGFQECSGLDLEMDVTELQEGGRNNGVIRRVGRGKYSPIVLKRGMFLEVPEPPPDSAGGGPTRPARANAKLWEWLMSVIDGIRPVVRYDGVIEVLDNRGAPGGQVVASWSFERGLPAKVTGPHLNAKTGDIAIEELHIAHEGLRWVP